MSHDGDFGCDTGQVSNAYDTISDLFVDALTVPVRVEDLSGSREVLSLGKQLRHLGRSFAIENDAPLGPDPSSFNAPFGCSAGQWGWQDGGRVLWIELSVRNRSKAAKSRLYLQLSTVNRFHVPRRTSSRGFESFPTSSRSCGIALFVSSKGRLERGLQPSTSPAPSSTCRLSCHCAKTFC